MQTLGNTGFISLRLWLFIGSLFLLMSGKLFKVKTFKILSLHPTQVWFCWPWEIYLLEGIYLEMACSKLNLSLFCSSQSSNNLLGIWLCVTVLWVSSGIRICKRTKHRYGVVIACLQTWSSAGKTWRNEFKAILGYISRLFQTIWCKQRYGWFVWGCYSLVELLPNAMCHRNLN